MNLLRKLNGSPTTTWLFLLCTVLLLLSSCRNSNEPDWRQIKVGLFQNNPLIFTNEAGQPAGVFVDLLTEIARHEHWHIEYVAASLDEGLTLLRDGQLDLMTSLVYSWQRNQLFDFSKETVSTQWGIVYVPLLSAIEQLSDLRGKRVGILKDGINGINFITLLEIQKISCHLISFANYDDIFAALEKHEIDAGVVNNVYGVNNCARYRIRNTSILFTPELPLFATPKGTNPDLLKRIDQYLRYWKKDPHSVYYRTLNRWVQTRHETRVEIPLWFNLLLIMVVFGSILLLIWNYFLKRIVARKTLALQQSEEQLQLIIRGANDAPWDWDMRSDSVYFSPQWWLQIGLKPDPYAMTRERWLTLIHPEDANRVVRMFSGFLRHATETFEFEFRLRHRLGHYVPLLCRGIISRASTGRPVRVTGSNMDLTDQKRAAESLYESNAILQAAMNHSPVGIAIINAADGQIGYINKVGRKILAIDVDNICSVRLQYQLRSQFYDLAERPLAIADSPIGRALLHNESGSCELLFRSRRKESERIIAVNAGPIQNEQGKVQSAIVIFSDITEKKRQEREHQQLEAHLHQAQKIESIGQLAGGVAHDFNNMLGVILGHAQMAQKKYVHDKKLVKHLSAICQAGQHSADLTRQLLTFARKQTVEPIVIDLNDKVSGMLSMLRRLIGEQVKLCWKPDKHLWHTCIDPVQIDQIIVNLSINARDALDGSGKIIITTQNWQLPEYSPLLLEHNVAAGDYILLSVSDNGCGISDEIRQNIFEPFFTTKGHGLGTGLGLATVYGAVQQNHGFITLETAPGQGTEFRIFLPRYDLPESHCTQETTMSGQQYGGETILLVEDEIQLLQLSKSMLEDIGYQVLVAATPEQAINLATSYPTTIDLLISDLIMPGMNGLELSEKIAALRPQIRKLFISGYTADILSQQDLVGRDFHFLQKPVSQELLGEKVSHILRTVS